MRIVFLNSVRGGGGGASSATTLARGLARAGHDVTMVCNAKGQLRHRLERDADVALAPVRMGPDFDPLAAFTLARLLRRARADVVLGDRRKDIKLLVLARVFGARTPIVHRHGAPSVLRSSWLYRFLWRRVRALIVNSDAMRSALLDAAPWLESLPIDVVHNAVDTDRFRPRPELRDAARSSLGIGEEVFLICAHGALQKRKRFDLLLRAVGRLRSDLQPVLLIVGDGPERRTLESLARALDVHAIFTGYRDDVPELLATGDVAAHVSGAEGFANSVLEALACGLPVVATDEHSHPEQIDDGITGFLVPPDAAALADALARLAEDRDGRVAMSRAARETAMTRFGINTMVLGYEHVFTRVVKA